MPNTLIFDIPFSILGKGFVKLAHEYKIRSKMAPLGGASLYGEIQLKHFF